MILMSTGWNSVCCCWCQQAGTLHVVTGVNRLELCVLVLLSTDWNSLCCYWCQQGKTICYYWCQQGETICYYWCQQGGTLLLLVSTGWNSVIAGVNRVELCYCWCQQGGTLLLLVSTGWNSVLFQGETLCVLNDIMDRVKWGGVHLLWSVWCYQSNELHDQRFESRREHKNNL